MITPSTIAAEITSETQLSATRAVVSGLRDRKHRRKPQAPRAPNTRGRIHDNPLGYDAVVVARPVHQRPPSSVRRLAASRPDDVVVSCRRAGTRLVRIDDDGRGRVPVRSGSALAHGVHSYADAMSSSRVSPDFSLLDLENTTTPEEWRAMLHNKIVQQKDVSETFRPVFLPITVANRTPFSDFRGKFQKKSHQQHQRVYAARRTGHDTRWLKNESQ